MEPAATTELLRIHSLQDKNLIITFKEFCYTVSRIKTVFPTQLKEVDGWEDFVKLCSKPAYWQDYMQTSTTQDIVNYYTSDFLYGCIGMFSSHPVIMKYISSHCVAWPWLLATIDKRLTQQNIGRNYVDLLVHEPHTTRVAQKNRLDGLLSTLARANKT
jgi:hypothetical protein